MNAAGTLGTATCVKRESGQFIELAHLQKLLLLPQFQLPDVLGTPVTSVVNVLAPAAVTISGTSAICAAAPNPLTVVATPVAGTGNWSSNNAAVATVNTTTGVVTGVASGTATITYNYTVGGCLASGGFRCQCQFCTNNHSISSCTAGVGSNADLTICQGTQINLTSSGSVTPPTTVSKTNTYVRVFRIILPLLLFTKPLILPELVCLRH